MRRRALATAAALGVFGVLALASAGVASASGLGLLSQGRAVVAVAHPCPGAAQATALPGAATTGGVAVTLPAGCATRPVEVTVLSGTTVLASGSASVTGSGTVPTGAFTPTSALTVRATVSGWDLPTTWTYAPVVTAISCAPVDPTVTATCRVDLNARSWNFWGSGYRLDFNVRTDSPTPFVWEVRFDLSATGFAVPGGATVFPGYPVPAGAWYPAWTPSTFSQSNLCAASSQAQLPVVRLRGSAAFNATVSSSDPARSMGFQAMQSGGGALSTLACP